VTAVYRGTSYIQLIQGVSIEFTAGGDERISVEMKNV
jgi:hypothetical protein